MPFWVHPVSAPPYYQRTFEEIVGDDPDIVFSGINFSNPDDPDPSYEHVPDRKMLKAFMVRAQ